MTSIDASQRLAALLRSQVPAFRQVNTARRGEARPARAAGEPAPDLASVVAQRIQSLSRDDPDRKRKALRIFLETLLLQKLGSRLIDDPAFTEMVDALGDQMQADSQVAAATNRLSELLVSADRR